MCIQYIYIYILACMSLAAEELSPRISMALSVILVRDADSADPRKISPPTNSLRSADTVLSAGEAIVVPPNHILKNKNGHTKHNR